MTKFSSVNDNVKFGKQPFTSSSMVVTILVLICRCGKDFTHRPLHSCTSIESRSSQEHLRRSTVKVNLDYDDDINLDDDFHVSYFSFCYAAQSSALSPRKGKYKFI